MKLGNWRIPTLLQSDSSSTGLSEVHASEDEITEEQASKIWPTALLVAGTALLGAAALGFWNRRTIASMRKQIGQESESLTSISKSEEIL